MSARAKRRGRPKKAAPRHPCGKLVQTVEPNAKVVELRRALLGTTPADLAAAEDPMALALARGWLSEDQHRAGVSYAQAWRRSHPQRRNVGALPEVPEAAGRDLRAIRQMGDAEIAQAFDAILDATRAAPSLESEVEARTRYNAMTRAMTPSEQTEVFLGFCLQSWPQWILQRCAGRFETSWERKHRLLVAGLEALVGQLRRGARARRGEGGG